MTIQELYNFAIEKGLELDPRGPEELARQMQTARAEYEGLDEKGRSRGLNGFLDAAMERFGAFEVIPCSRFVRVERGSA
jgi:hypothetical protein